VRDRRGFDDNIYNIPYICRPANLPKINPGKCSLSIKIGIIKVGVFVVLIKNINNQKLLNFLIQIILSL
jgi:hypothetical protein